MGASYFASRLCPCFCSEISRIYRLVLGAANLLGNWDACTSKYRANKDETAKRVGR